MVELITRPLDEELNVNKKEIHKPKDIPFKMPELVVPVPSIGEGIDVNAPKVDTITTPQLKGGIDVNEGNINISKIGDYKENMYMMKYVELAVRKIM